MASVVGMGYLAATAKGGASELLGVRWSDRRNRQRGGYTMNYRTAWSLDGVGALAMLAAMALGPSDAAARSVRQELHPTGGAQNARGRAVGSIHRAARHMRGRRTVD